MIQEDWPVATNLTQSSNFKLYQVNYSIKVFVKYDRITERGEGDCVTIPIRIIERPVDHRPKKSNYFRAGEELIALKAREPIEFKPTDYATSYYETLVKPYEEQWLKHAVADAEPFEPEFPAPMTGGMAAGGIAGAVSAGGGSAVVQKEADSPKAIWDRFVSAGTIMDEFQIRDLFEELKINVDEDPAFFAMSF